MIPDNPFLKFSRVPEPELMVEKEQVEAYAEANFEGAHELIILSLLNHLPQKFSPKTMIDLGAGPGDMTSRLLKCFPEAQLTVLDGSKSMMEKNKYHLNKLYPFANIKWEITSIQNYIPEFSHEFIFSNSLLHHLQDPFDFWETIQRSSNENTFVFICDLLRPSSFEKVGLLVEQYTRNENEILKKDFYNSLLAAYTIEEVESMLREIRMDQKLKVDLISDRHWICYTKQFY
jgi:trans-aconitate methyltransferase